MITGSIGLLPSASLGPGRARPLRAGPRLGARHRRHGRRQPHRHLPVRGHDAPLLARRPRGGRAASRGRSTPSSRAAPARATSAATSARRTCATGSSRRSGNLRRPAEDADAGSREDLDERGAGRLAGRARARAVARPALRHHGLRGHPRVRRRGGHGGLPARRPPRAARAVGGDVPHAPARTRAPRCGWRSTRSSRPTGSAAATSARSSLRGYGTMGLFPLEAPVDVAVAAWEWGAYLGEEGLRKGIRAKISSWRRIGSTHHPGDRQGGRPVPQLDPREDRVPQGRLPGGDPPQRGRLRGRRLRREPLPRARRRAGHAAGPRVDPRGHHARQHHRAGRRRGHPGGRSARSPAASSTPPTRSSSPAPPPRSAR